MEEALRALAGDATSAQRDLSDAVLRAVELQRLPAAERARALAALDPRGEHARAVLRQLDPAALAGALGRMQSAAAAARLLQAVAPSQRAAALVMGRAEANFAQVCRALPKQALAEALARLGPEERGLVRRRLDQGAGVIRPSDVAPIRV